jgi:hypothetical protein
VAACAHWIVTLLLLLLLLLLQGYGHLKQFSDKRLMVSSTANQEMATSHSRWCCHCVVHMCCHLMAPGWPPCAGYAYMAAACTVMLLPHQCMLHICLAYAPLIFVHAVAASCTATTCVTVVILAHQSGCKAWSCLLTCLTGCLTG